MNNKEIYINKKEIYMNKKEIKNNEGNYTKDNHITRTLNDEEDTKYIISIETTIILSYYSMGYSIEDIKRMAQERSFAINPDEIEVILLQVERMAKKHNNDKKVAKKLKSLRRTKKEGLN